MDILKNTAAKLCLLLLFLSSTAEAKSKWSLLLTMGAGTKSLVENQKSDTTGRILSLGVQYELKTNVDLQFKAGWFNKPIFFTASSTFFLSAVPHYKVFSNVDHGFFFSTGAGIALLNTVKNDKRLNSIFQFQFDFSLGIQDKEGRAISFFYTHWSDGTHTNKNKGRDYRGIEVKIPLD